MEEFLPAGRDWSRNTGVNVQGPTFVRFEVVEDGEPVALSNPLYFDLTPDEGGGAGPGPTKAP